MNFSPVQAIHTEFTATNQTITIVETELDDYVVNDVTYVCESGATFPDMKITWASNTWTYRSTFDYAIPRKVSYYNIDKNDSSKLHYGVSWNVPTLADYDVAYGVETFVETTNVIFTVKGKQRHATRVGADESGSGGTLVWGDWYDFSTTYVTVIKLNHNKSIEIIQKVVLNGNIAKSVANNV